MSILRALRGAPMVTLPVLGQNLTLYRKGSKFGLSVGVATVVLFQLPFRLLSDAGQLLQLLIAACGFCLAATLVASRGPAGVREKDVAKRWL
jgi:hypothetical protein